jgi:hypothetical protein
MYVLVPLEIEPELIRNSRKLMFQFAFVFVSLELVGGGAALPFPCETWLHLAII